MFLILNVISALEGTLNIYFYLIRDNILIKYLDNKICSSNNSYSNKTVVLLVVWLQLTATIQKIKVQ